MLKPVLPIPLLFDRPVELESPELWRFPAFDNPDELLRPGAPVREDGSRELDNPEEFTNPDVVDIPVEFVNPLEFERLDTDNPAASIDAKTEGSRVRPGASRVSPGASLPSPEEFESPEELLSTD